MLSQRMDKRVTAFSKWVKPITVEEYEAETDEVAQLEQRIEELEEALDLIAEDALWHDGLDNPEALEDIRKTVKSLGYTKQSLAQQEES